MAISRTRGFSYVAGPRTRSPMHVSAPPESSGVTASPPCALTSAGAVAPGVKDQPLPCLRSPVISSQVTLYDLRHISRDFQGQATQKEPRGRETARSGTKEVTAHGGRQPGPTDRRRWWGEEHGERRPRTGVDSTARSKTTRRTDHSGMKVRRADCPKW